jgi:hypothetical protein
MNAGISRFTIGKLLFSVIWYALAFAVLAWGMRGAESAVRDPEGLGRLAPMIAVLVSGPLLGAGAGTILGSAGWGWAVGCLLGIAGAFVALIAIVIA